MTTETAEKWERWAEEKAVEVCLFLLQEQEDERVFLGTANDLADAVGIHQGSIWAVLNTARDPRFIERHGYVVPFVAKGPGPKTWRCVDSTGDDEGMEAIYHGEMIRGRDALIALVRVLAHKTYRQPSFDGRTATGKRERRALVQTEAALISLEEALR